MFVVVVELSNFFMYSRISIIKYKGDLKDENRIYFNGKWK